jgi:hypothetical protein
MIGFCYHLFFPSFRLVLLRFLPPPACISSWYIYLRIFVPSLPPSPIFYFSYPLLFLSLLPPPVSTFHLVFFSLLAF